MACKYYINNKVLNEQEIKEYISSNYIKESDIKLTTLGDIADILAYSNSKLILDGYTVEYTTPDNMKFKTYQEASNHISELAKSVKDVDLNNVDLPVDKPYNIIDWSSGKAVRTNLFFENEEDALEYTKKNRKLQEDVGWNLTVQKHPVDFSIKSFIEKNKEYEQSKEIIEEWKKVNNIQYNPEEIYSRGQEFVSVVGAYSNFDVNLMMQNLLQHIEDNEKAGGKFAISAFTKPIDRLIPHLEGGGSKIKFKIYPQSQDILWAANTDVFSGSVWDASEKVSKDKKSELLGVSYTKYPSLRSINEGNTHLEYLFKQLKIMESFEEKDFKNTTKKTIDWAKGLHKYTNIQKGISFESKENDVEKALLENINNTKELIKEQEKNNKGVQPNLASIIDDLSHHHNELAISLNFSNFEIEVDEDVPYQTKKIIDSINKILEQKRNGKLVKPEIKKGQIEKYKVKSQEYFEGEVIETEQNFNTLKEAEDFIEKRKIFFGEKNMTIEITKGIQPTTTKETLKESISTIKNRTIVPKLIDWRIVPGPGGKGMEWAAEYVLEGEDSDIVFFNTEKEARDFINSFKNTTGKEKEYTEQALINTKIAALKEVAKKYPRSLIRSEVRPISSSSNLGFAEDELPFQKVSDNAFQQFQQSLNKPNTNPILQGNQANIEEIITQLEKEGLLEIDCKGKLKAEKGLATSFVKGGKWKVIKDLKGYPTHKEGGVDLTIGKGGVSIKNGNTQFTAKYGLVIPKN